MYQNKIYINNTLSSAIFLVAFFLNYFAMFAPALNLYLFFVSGLMISAAIYYFAIFVAQYYEKVHLSKASFNTLILLYFFIFLNLFNHFRLGIGGYGGDIIYDSISFIMFMSGVIFLRCSNNDFYRFCNAIFILAFLLVLLGIKDITVRQSIHAEFYGYPTSGPLSMLRSVSFFSIYLIIFSFTVLRNKRLQYFSVVLFIVYVLLGFYFGKRDFAVASLGLILFFIIPKILFMKNSNKKNDNIPLFIFIVIFIIIGFLVKDTPLINMFEKLVGRFEMVIDNFAVFNRFRETRDFFYDATALDIVIGKPAWHWHENIARHLHLGYPNLIMKGGIFFLFFILFIIMKNIIIALRMKNNRVKFFVLAICLNSLLWMTHSSFWGWDPSSIIFGFTLFAPDIGKHFDDQFLINERKMNHNLQIIL